jgi:hypothetical protein
VFVIHVWCIPFLHIIQGCITRCNEQSSTYVHTEKVKTWSTVIQCLVVWFSHFSVCRGASASRSDAYCTYKPCWKALWNTSPLHFVCCSLHQLTLQRWRKRTEARISLHACRLLMSAFSISPQHFPASSYLSIQRHVKALEFWRRTNIHPCIHM